MYQTFPTHPISIWFWLIKGSYNPEMKHGKKWTWKMVNLI